MTEVAPGLLTLALLVLVWIRNEQRWREFRSEIRKELDRMWTEVLKNGEEIRDHKVLPMPGIDGWVS